MDFGLKTKLEKIKTSKLSKNFFWVVGVFISWFLIIYLVTFLSVEYEVFPHQPTFTPPDHEKLSDIFYRLNNFDGLHYQTIATHGYKFANLVQAFFPLYPLLIFILSFSSFSPLSLSLLISFLAALGFCLTAFSFLQEKYSLSLAKNFILISLLLPTSFFLLAGYSESLFLFLTLMTFKAYEKKQYFLVALFASLLSATRIVGALLPLVLLGDYLFKLWQQKKPIVKKDWLNILLIFGGISGLLFYMLYLNKNFSDPFYFMTVQQQFGSGRETSRLILLPQTIYRYLKMFIVGLPLDWKTYAIFQEFCLSLLYFGIILGAFWQNWRQKQEVFPLPWLLFSLGAYLVPTLTGNFSSMPRYLLVCLAVPLFLAFKTSKRSFWFYLLLILSASTMLLNLALFVQGYWIA